MPPIPLYEGTRPYQTIPFQWSLHAIADDGVLVHRAFLADGGEDPRRRFAETLIDALGELPMRRSSSIRLRADAAQALAAQFPDLGRGDQRHHRPPGGPAAGRARRRSTFPNFSSATRSSRLRRRCAPVSATTISALSPTAWRRRAPSCSWPPASSRLRGQVNSAPGRAACLLPARYPGHGRGASRADPSRQRDPNYPRTDRIPYLTP